MDAVSRVCPFSDNADNEDQIAQSLYAALPPAHPVLGHVHKTYAGAVASDALVEGSSAGGLTTWLCAQLMRSGQVDGVIHVGPSDSGPDLFEYRVSESVEALHQNRKSKYYSASFEKALRSVVGNGRRYVFVGVPCYVKAVRLLSRQDPQVAQAVAFTVALICGHMKSSGFAELMAWQVGVPPQNLAAVDFRLKDREARSSDYRFGAKAAGEPEFLSKRANTLMGGNWGHAMFQLDACNFCDDIFGETADIAFGDAWVRPYTDRWQGANIVVSRSAALSAVLAAGVASGEIWLDDVPAEVVLHTQEGNFRHRREGLAVRLAAARKAGRWVPRKRVAPGQYKVSSRRRALIALREEMGNASHAAFQSAKQAGDLARFFAQMNPYIEKMAQLSKKSLLERIKRKLGRVLSSLTGTASA